jgi:hypothetical protein
VNFITPSYLTDLLVERTLRDEKQSNHVEQTPETRLALYLVSRMCSSAELDGLAASIVANVKPGAAAAGKERGQACFSND